MITVTRALFVFIVMSPAFVAKAAEVVIKGDLASNLTLLNQRGEQPVTVQQLYKAAYEIFAANPGATFADLAADVDFRRFCEQHRITHLGGPMLGAVGPDRVRVWLRTVRPAKVEVQVTVDGAEKSFGPVESTPETDLTVVVSVTGLKPEARHPYRVLVDGEPIATAEHAAIITTPAHEKPAKVRIAFGTCPHRWGLGNQKQADLILSRQPAALLLRQGKWKFTDSVN